MPVKTDSLLKILGYKIDIKGNIRISDSQMAVITLEDTEEGGILRIHGDSSAFFYSGDEIMESAELYLPHKMNSKFVYFSDGMKNGFKVSKREFTESVMHAMAEYQKEVSKEGLRG